jgi:HemY protein
MAKLFIYTLLAVVVALIVTLYLDIPNDPGYLLIAWRSYTFETSLFALVVAIIVLVILFKLIFVFASWVNPWHLIRYGRRYKEMRQVKTKSHTMEGLMHFVRSNWQSSYNVLTRSFKDKDATVINYLAAAYAAYGMERKDLWTECLDQAVDKYPANISTINSLRAELLFRTNQLEQSLVVLERLKKTSINDNHLLNLLKEVYIKLKDWQRLEDLLPVLENNNVIDSEEAMRIEMRLLVEEMTRIVDEIKQEKQPRNELLTTLHKKWNKARNTFKQDEKVVNYYVNLLLKIADNNSAVNVIESCLNKAWSDLLIAKYGEADFSHSAQQLVNAERWLKERPNNNILLLALGRICMRNELWGKAREYFEASLSISASTEVYGELSRLYRALGEQEKSDQYFSKYTEMVGIKLPELPLPQELEKATSDS